MGRKWKAGQFRLVIEVIIQDDPRTLIPEAVRARRLLKRLLRQHEYKCLKFECLEELAGVTLPAERDVTP